MCGEYCKPCVKTGDASKGDTFSVNKHYIDLNGQKFYIGDVVLTHYIEGVFIRFVSLHAIDNLVAGWLMPWTGKDSRIGLVNYVRDKLKNPEVPTTTVYNRLERLIKQGEVSSGYFNYDGNNHYAITEKGYKIYTKFLMQNAA